jgi:hypothetical protein
MMREASTRVKELSAVQVAYLSKGMIGLRRLVNDKNAQTELELREAIKAHAIANSDQYDPYSVSKVLRYLFAYNDGSEQSIQAFQALGQRFLANLHDR